MDTQQRVIAYLDIDPAIVKQWVYENSRVEWSGVVRHFLQECNVGDFLSENFTYNPSDGSIYQTHDTDFLKTHFPYTKRIMRIHTALDALSLAYDIDSLDKDHARFAQWLKSMAASCKRFEYRL